MELPPFLADTWWFGLTQRMSAERFDRASMLRVGQGFTAIQLVVGVPPEIGPAHPSARSEAGFPWSRAGAPNPDYLLLARQRIALLNERGLLVIVYGAWGHQIRWLGTPGMIRWWRAVVDALSDLDVVWCLTGEADLWIGEEQSLLPDRATDGSTRHLSLAGRVRRRLAGKRWIAGRRAAWTTVLEALAAATDKPILIHPTPRHRGLQLVDRPELLAADTLQTGHDEGSRNHLWQRVVAAAAAAGPRGVINLEPWYEGITGRFGTEDQLFAYWVTMLAGARAACYGAQGLWNAGDGRFLAHWGGQTLDQALALESPRWIGASHRQWLSRGTPRGTTSVTFDPDDARRLASIARIDGRREVRFIVDTARDPSPLVGDVWLPLAARYATRPPTRGPAVLFVDRDAV